ncbi:MAG: hypothetical protein A2283_15520 [Lentisphaerae bacterium RIFOXYA12_FULL_48_11]|nr:MAG: hypothetical protein A2283_15520 [Lentisphaerae bacterium RIFOXYA12_FULL_48_11]
MTSEPASLPAEIIEYIRECMARENGESYLIPVLQRIQKQFGYLAKEHMNQVSQLMQIPAVKVTGVATFYHFFSFIPKGEIRITICMGTACFVRGADKVLAKLSELLAIAPGQTTPDGKFSLECARCLGACALAPIVLVNDRVYGNVLPADVPKILKEYGFEKPVQPKPVKQS